MKPKPAAGVPVKVKLARHEFKFGCSLFLLEQFPDERRNNLYREEFKKVFNYGVMPLYWDTLEPEQGKPRFAKDSPKVYRRPAPDLCVEYCDENNIVPKLHCLNYDQWTPVWVDPHNVPEVKRLLEKRFKEIAERYGDKIPGMEVINETLCGWCDVSPVRQSRSTDFFGENDLISWSFDTARK